MSGTPKANIKHPAVRIERDPMDVYRNINEAWVTLADLYEELGRAMSEERRARRMAQRDIAQKMGISRDMVCLYETGKRWKSDSPHIERMAMLLSKTSG